MLDLKRIGVFARDEIQDYRVDAMTKLFARAGIELVPDARAEEADDLDLVIAMGGDGTVLRALVAYPNTPVLAVNFGNVGFLTQTDREHLEKVLVRLLSDDYFLEERLTLQVEHNGEHYRAINEVVLKGVNHMVEVGISVNGRLVHTSRGDGLIVGTPTGSTAYLLSTGAPLVVPDVDCIIVNPLNEYSMSSRAVILNGSADIEVSVRQAREGDLGMVVDGRPRRPVATGDVIKVIRSPMPARLVCFETDYFFRNLRERLRW